MTETNRIEFKRELTREMVESLGSGMNRIMSKYIRDNFEFGGNYVRMIVPYNWIPKEGEVEESNAGKNNDTKNVGSFVGSLSEVKLTERQEEICVILKENPLSSAKTMSEELSVVQRTIERDLSYLQEKGVVKHHGNTSGGYWEVINKEQ